MTALQLVEGTGRDDGWPRLHPDAMYGVIGDAVRILDPLTEADPAAILLTLICAVGVSVGSGPRIAAGMELQPTRFQVWVVGNSAVGRKGSSWGAAKSVMVVADEDLITKRVMSGFGSGEALVDAVADSESGDTRLLVLAKEGGGLLSVMARTGDTTSTVVRESYDTDLLSVRSRTKTSVAKNAHIGITAHITPSDLAGQLTETQIRNGFANRGLFCMSRRSKFLPRGVPNPPEVAQIGVRLGNAIRKARSVGLVEWDERTGYAWDLAYRSFGQGAPSAKLADLEARGDMHCMRIAMLFAILDGGRLIERQHLTAALAVWEYCRDSARLLFGPTGAVEDAGELNSFQRDRKIRYERMDKLWEAHMPAGEVTLNARQRRAIIGGSVTSSEVESLTGDLVKIGKLDWANPIAQGRGRPPKLTVGVSSDAG